MPPEFVLDAGPIVAYFNPRDEHHAWAVRTLNPIETCFATCEPVLVEAFHLLSPAHGAPDRLAEFCRPENIQIDFQLLNRMRDVRDLMRKYHDQPMDLADACLVLLAEQHSNAAIITTDRDFLLYRTRTRRQLRLLAPFSN